LIHQVAGMKMGPSVPGNDRVGGGKTLQGHTPSKIAHEKNAAERRKKQGPRTSTETKDGVKRKRSGQSPKAPEKEREKTWMHWGPRGKKKKRPERKEKTTLTARPQMRPGPEKKSRVTRPEIPSKKTANRKFTQKKSFTSESQRQEPNPSRSKDEEGKKNTEGEGVQHHSPGLRLS